MASKYASYEDDEEAWVSHLSRHKVEEPFTITNGVWKNLTKDELLALPWIKEAYENPKSTLGINDCFGFSITEISEGGSIRSGKDVFYIAKNTRRPSRLVLKQMWRDDEGYVRPDPLNEFWITKVEVIMTYRYYADGRPKPFY
jgi:hypothetical protein